MNHSFENYNISGNLSDYEYDMFDYDIPDTFDSNTIIKFVPAVTVYSLTFILGFIGNLLVIFAVKKHKKLHSITNMFLLSLASADLLLIIVCVPLRITEFFSHYWILGKFLCKTLHYIQNVSAFSSVLNLTAMSLERYFAILHPLRAKYICTKSRARRIIVVIWILSFIAAIPIIFGKSTVEFGVRYKVNVCKRVWLNPYWELFEMYRATIILFLPILIMLFAYTSICVELWKMPIIRKDYGSNDNSKDIVTVKFSKQFDKKSTTETTNKCLNDQQYQPLSQKSFKKKAKKPSWNKYDDESTRKQIVKMLVIIIGLFFLCWAPITINNILVGFGKLPNANEGILWHLRMYFSVLSYFNSCLNPIVYAFMSRNFREGFKISISACLNRDKLSDVVNKKRKSLASYPRQTTETIVNQMQLERLSRSQNENQDDGLS